MEGTDVPQGAFACVAGLLYLGDAGFTSLLKKGDRMEGTDAPKGPLACVVGPYYFGVAGFITS